MNNDLKIPSVRTSRHTIDHKGKYNRFEDNSPRDDEPYLDADGNPVKKSYPSDINPLSRPENQFEAIRIGNVVINGRLHQLNRERGSIQYIYPANPYKWDEKQHGSVRSRFIDWNSQRPLSFDANISPTGYYYEDENGDPIPYHDSFTETQSSRNPDSVIPPNPIGCGQLYASKKCGISSPVCSKEFGVVYPKDADIYMSDPPVPTNLSAIYGRDCNASPSQWKTPCRKTFETCKSILDFKPDASNYCNKNRASCQNPKDYKPYADINQFKGWIDDDINNFKIGINNTVIGSVRRLYDGNEDRIGWTWDANNKTLRLGGTGPGTPGFDWYWKSQYSAKLIYNKTIETVRSNGMSFKYGQVFTCPYPEKYIVASGGTKDDGPPNATTQEWVNQRIAQEFGFNLWRYLEIKTPEEFKKMNVTFNTDYLPSYLYGGDNITEIGGAVQDNTVIKPELSAEPIYTHLYFCESDKPNFDNNLFKQKSRQPNDPYHKKDYDYPGDENNIDKGLQDKFDIKKIRLVTGEMIQEHIAASRLRMYSSNPENVAEIQGIDYKTPLPLEIKPKTAFVKDSNLFIVSKINSGFISKYMMSVIPQNSTQGKNYYLETFYNNFINDKYLNETYTVTWSNLVKEKYEYRCQRLAGWGSGRDAIDICGWIFKGWEVDINEDEVTETRWIDNGRILNYRMINNPKLNRKKLYYLVAEMDGIINEKYNPDSVNYDQTGAIRDSFLGLACQGYDKSGMTSEHRCIIGNPTLHTYMMGFSGLKKEEVYEKGYNAHADQLDGIIPYKGPTAQYSDIEYEPEDPYIWFYGKLFLDMPYRNKFKKGDIIANWKHNVLDIYDIVTGSNVLGNIDKSPTFDTSDYLRGDYYVDYHNGKYYLYVWCWEVMKDPYIGEKYSRYFKKIAEDSYGNSVYDDGTDFDGNMDVDYVTEVAPVLWCWESEDGINFKNGKRVSDSQGRTMSCRFNVAKCKHWNGDKCILPTQDCHAVVLHSSYRDYYQALGNPIIEKWSPQCDGKGLGTKDTNLSPYTYKQENPAPGEPENITLYRYYHHYNKYMAARFGWTQTRYGPDDQAENIRVEAWKRRYGWLGDYGIDVYNLNYDVLVAKKYTPDIISFDNNKRDPMNSGHHFTDGFDNIKYAEEKGWKDQEIEPTWQRSIFSPQVGKNVVINGKCLKNRDGYKPWCENEECEEDGNFEPRHSFFVFGPEFIYDMS